MKTKTKGPVKSIEVKQPSKRLLGLKRLCRRAFPNLFAGEGSRQDLRNAHDMPPMVKIHASELQAIARKTAEQSWEETGGHLFGAWDNRGQPVVMVATPPGPASIHTSVTFTQDLAYCQTCGLYLSDQYGLDLVGRWHSHHRLDLSRESEGDRMSAKSIMDKMGIAVFVEVILTISPKNGRVQVHAYVYKAGEPFVAQSAKLVILPGLSPLREASFGSVVFEEQNMYAWRFSLDHIEIAGTTADPLHGMVQALEQQLSQLPLEVQKGAKVIHNDGAVSIEVPLPGGNCGYIGYASEHPDQPVAVFLRRAGAASIVDATPAFSLNKQTLSLVEVYHQLRQSCLGQNRVRPTILLPVKGINSEGPCPATEMPPSPSVIDDIEQVKSPAHGNSDEAPRRFPRSRRIPDTKTPTTA